MRLSLKDYYKSTPPIMRKIGDSLAVACGSIVMCSLIGNYPKLGAWALGGMALGKFMTNCFSEDKDAK